MAYVKNYYQEDTVPGDGNIAYDIRHADKVVYGFNHHKVSKEHQEARLNWLIEDRNQLNADIRDLRRQLRNNK